MGIGIAAIVVRGAADSVTVYTREGTTSHESIIEKHGLRDTDTAQLARVYLASPDPRDYFRPEKYRLLMRSAAYLRRYGPQRVLAGYENEWPDWFDPEKQEHVRAQLFRKLEAALAARPIVVNSFLDLSGSDMTSLPQLYVRDSVNIEYSQIAELAPGTRIVGSLYATCSKLTRLPEDLTVGCNPDDPANGSLMIEGLPITELPESLTVGGVIRTAGSRLTWDGIPEKLWSKVQGLGPYPSSSRHAAMSQ